MCLLLVWCAWCLLFWILIICDCCVVGDTGADLFVCDFVCCEFTASLVVVGWIRLFILCFWIGDVLFLCSEVAVFWLLCLVWFVWRLVLLCLVCLDLVCLICFCLI